MSKNTKVNRSKGAGRWLLAAAAVAGLSVVAVGQNARATATTLGSFTLNGFQVTGDTNPLNARVIFSYVTGSSNGNLDVTIENNSMPQSDGELIRNIEFQMSNGPSAIAPPNTPVDAYLPNGATEVNVSASPFTTATIAAGSSTNLSNETPGEADGGQDGSDAWTVTSDTGSYWNLTSPASGKPELYVGPSLGGPSDEFVNYASINPSVEEHSPVLAGPVTFQFNVAGLAANSSISNVLVGYGTSGGITGPLPSSSTPTPEPSVLAFLGMGAIGSLMVMRKRRHP